MAYETLNLPKDKQALSRVIIRHVRRAEQMLAYRRTNWLLAWYYLNGYRRFDVFDPDGGQLSSHLLDEKGNMEFQSQDLLYHINQVAGRIQSMDCRLQVNQQGFSLEGQRNRSLAQIIGDSIVSDDQIRQVQEDFGWIFSCLGFAGLQGIVVDHPTIGLTSDIEVIHPRELFPFPMTGQDHTKLRGILRQRMVPVEYLKEVYGRKIESHFDEMEWYQFDVGEAWADWQQNSAINYWGSRGTGGPAENLGRLTRSPRNANARGEYAEIVKVQELWILGPQNTVRRYIVNSGDYIIDDQDLEGLEVYCPIGWARFFNNGSFHGAGMFDLMYSVHRQFELLSKSLYNNIQDLDRYGVLVLPSGQFNQNQMLKDIGRGLRCMFWEPDPISEGFTPFPIQPFNTGDMPGRVAQFAREALNNINPIQDLVQEKGRVDSASGLQFLDEQITKAITNPTTGVVRAFGGMYRSLTQKAGRYLTLSPRALPVGSLTLDLAGAVIDPKKSEVSFPENPLPSISRLSFSIRSISPRSTVARKQEAIQLWQDGISTDPLSFRLFAIKEDLDFAMWTDEEAGAYESAIRTILTVYGDGDSPGQAVITPHTTKPEVYLRLLSSFTNSPAMQVAQPAVHNAFKQLRLTILSYMGMILPQGIPNPDDAAMLQQSFMSAAPPAAGMPGMLPQGNQMGSPASRPASPSQPRSPGGPPVQGSGRPSPLVSSRSPR